MIQQTVQIEPPLPARPANLVFQNYQKTGLIIFVAALLYLRLSLRRRKSNRVCPQCNSRNPHHRSNCIQCSAPLMVTSFKEHLPDA